MVIKNAMPSIVIVAPVRERGLKLVDDIESAVTNGRSREGAWIEIE